MPEQLSSEKQAVILDAARKRFAYYGFSKVTMDEIAADVGMGKASLYYYFPTKEKLFEEVVKQEKNQFFNDINLMIEKKVSSSDMLRRYAARRIEHFRNLANLRALITQQNGEMRACSIELFKEFQMQEVKVLQEILQLGKKNGELGTPNPQQSAEAIMQMLYGPRSWYLHKLQRDPDDETYRLIEQATKEIVEIILNGIRKRK
ncbi:MAG TPA: TetR/AcrR family transcriptional regulator [Candidatus Acidoferrales bacterium]|nr:TetR/AcrR family transcriptional regulator [Candidatus Acidoferrales bacterium]